MIDNEYYRVALSASTSKISNELKNIKESDEKKKNEIRRRWIWELIQNASDCTPKDRGINIEIEVEADRICFSHDGTPFSYQNLFSLITQVSTKEESQEELTGKFGTGFMSTFLLSEQVEIKGTFIRKDGTLTNMNFVIDRTQQDYDGIKESSIEMLKNLETLNSSGTILKDQINETQFIYPLKQNTEIMDIIEQGATDLKSAMLYVLAFNRNIHSITYNKEVYELDYSNDSDRIVKIKDKNESLSLLISEQKNVTIACPVKIDSANKLILFLEINATIPKLFCKFPLIGTEEYAFPVIVNSNSFDVEIDRNAIRDGNANNKTLIDTAIELYKSLIDQCVASKKTRNEFNICYLRKSNYSGLQKHCYDELYSYIKNKNLVPVYDASSDDTSYIRESFLDSEGKSKILLPSSIKKENEVPFWNLLVRSKWEFIPTLETFAGWRKVFGINLKLDNFNLLFKSKNFEDFNTRLNVQQKLDWLNEFYSLWIEDEKIEKISESVLVLAQDGEFYSIDTLYYDFQINDDLRTILFELNPNFKKNLINRDIIAFDSYFEKLEVKPFDTESCAQRIESKVTAILSEENINQEKRKTEIQTVFNKLTDFFLKEPLLAEKLFPKIFSKRMLLSSPEETLRRMTIAEKVEQNGLDLMELEILLTHYQKIKDILDNSALDDKGIREQLQHIVTSTPEMRRYFESLLSRSVKNVYHYLKKTKLYKLPETFEEWREEKYTETIFPVLKNDEELIIVIRPTDNDQIIFYGEEELEVLDSNKYELWTDNGVTQKNITLGYLLKTTEITKIPLKKL